MITSDDDDVRQSPERWIPVRDQEEADPDTTEKGEREKEKWPGRSPEKLPDLIPVETPKK